MESIVLNYEKDNQTAEMELKLRFLTPKLRVKITQIDQDYQKATKKVIKSLSKREKELFEMSKNAEEHTEDIMNLKEEDEALLFGIGNKQFILNDNYVINVFKEVIDVSSLNKEQKDLIYSENDGEFWQNANITQIADINHLFRTKNRI